MQIGKRSTLDPSVSQAPPHHRDAFRPDIEGLRGVCVTSVVLFHAFPGYLPGGFVGVDVFFVISGFLFTRILLAEFGATGHVDILAFWGRRVRRILPAATFVLACTSVIVCLLPAADAKSAGKEILSASLFYLNWRQAKEAVEYLAADGRDNLVLHYWSLAVEEQFYVVWPLFLTGILYLSRRVFAKQTKPIVTILSACLTISLVYAIYLTWENRPYAFFSTFTRVWQFLSGALVFLLPLRTADDGSRIVNRVLYLGCLATLAASFIFIGAATPYPGFAATIPTGAAAVLIWLGTDHAFGERGVLAAAPLRNLGRIAFSLYLWHWPLLVAAKQIQDSPANIALTVLLSIVLATATYTWIEQPIRRSPRLIASRPETFALGAVLLVAGVGSGLALKKFGPDSVVIGAGVCASAESITLDRPILYKDHCLLSRDDVQGKACAYGAASGDKTVILFGDSHAANWFPALNAAAIQEHWRLLVRTKASCVPVDAPQVRDGRAYWECDEWQKSVLSEIDRLKPNLIVVAGISNTYDEDSERRIFERLAAAAPTVVVRDGPNLPEKPVTCLRRTQNPNACTWRLNQVGGRVYPKTPENKFPANSRLVDFNDRLCPEGICKAVSDGIVLMLDEHHLTATRARTFAPAFAEILRSSAKDKSGS